MFDRQQDFSSEMWRVVNVAGCKFRVVNKHNNEQNGEIFEAKFRKKKYCQYVLNRKYQTENAMSDKDKSSIKLTNL